MLQSLEFPRDCVHIVVAHQAMEGVWRHAMVYCKNQCIETPYVLMEFHTRSAKFLMLKHIVGNPTTEGVGRHAPVIRISYVFVTPPHSHTPTHLHPHTLTFPHAQARANISACGP